MTTMLESRALPKPSTAEKWLERALAQVRDGEDAIPAVSAALTALQAEAAEAPADDDLDSYWDADGCVCPPALVGRGGFRGGCPLHDPFMQLTE